MQDPVLMAKRRALEKLIHETPDGHRVECTAIAMLIHVLFKILITIFKDEDKLCLRVYDIVQADNVDMLELFHEGDFTDSGGGCPFLCVEVYLLKCDDLISRP